jgi:integrase
MAYQSGSIYKNNGTWFLKYRTTELKDGTPSRVHKTERLCSVNGAQHHDLCSQRGEHRTKKSVADVRDKFMVGVNSNQSNGRPQRDMPVADFWREFYLPYCEEIVPLTGKARKKPSTVRGYKQIWKQHLETHFASMTLQQYEPYMGTQFLQSLTGTQGKNTLKHIKALGSSLFKRAVIEQRIKVNPWHDVSMPDDAIESKRTKHYTLEEAEDIISALVDHVDAQLVMALSCFLALRPSEIAALRWEDFDSENVHIRRGVVRGIVDVPKTPESIAPLPLIDQVRVPLELWRQKCGNPTEGWVFKKVRKIGEDVPADLHNMIARVIKPHVEGAERCVECDRVPKKSGVEWKSLYSGRRGACTAVIESTNGNYAVAQALLRHKSMTTTLNVYKKAITPEAFKNGMKLLEAAASNGKE